MSIKGIGYSAEFGVYKYGIDWGVGESYSFPHPDQSLINFMGWENYKKLNKEKINNFRKITTTVQY